MLFPCPCLRLFNCQVGDHNKQVKLPDTDGLQTHPDGQQTGRQADRQFNRRSIYSRHLLGSNSKRRSNALFTVVCHFVFLFVDFKCLPSPLMQSYNNCKIHVTQPTELCHASHRRSVVTRKIGSFA